MKAEIIEIVNNFKSKKGNSGSLIIAKTEDGNEIAIWNSNPSFQTAFRNINVSKREDGFFRMEGNFIAKSEEIKLKAIAIAELKELEA